MLWAIIPLILLGVVVRPRPVESTIHTLRIHGSFREPVFASRESADRVHRRLKHRGRGSSVIAPTGAVVSHFEPFTRGY